MSETIASIKRSSISTIEIKVNDTPIIDQNTLQQFEKIANHRLVRKLDKRIIPFMFLHEMGSYMNRVSVGHAQLMGISNELNLSQNESNWSISVFFLAYLIFAIPSNMLMRYLGPTRHLSFSIIAWGGITIGLAFVKNAAQLLSVRFLLGVAEAGFFPSIIIYFSLWYPKRNQTMRIAILFSAATASGVVGSILAYCFTLMDGIRGLSDWRWMYLLEGLPMIPLGIIICLFLKNLPDTVQWLNICEKQHLTNLLLQDEVVDNRDNCRLSWRQVLYVFIDWRIYLYAIICIGNLGLTKYLTTYFPSLVEGFDSLGTKVHLMVAPPYACAFVCCLLASYSSSRRNEHGFHLMFCLSVALLGVILMLTLIDQGKVAVYVGSCIACCGAFAAFPLILSWLSNNIGGNTKKSIAIGFVIGIGQTGGVIMPLVHYNDSSNQKRSNFICIGILLSSLVCTIILRICLMKENHRRDHLSQENYDREASIKEPCDWHPKVRYVL